MSSPTISSLPFPSIQPFPFGLSKAYSSPDISVPNSSPTRSVTSKQGIKTVRGKIPARLKSWGKASSIAENEDVNLTTQLSTCSTVTPEDRATSPCVSIASTDNATQTGPMKESVLSRGDTGKTLASNGEKRRPSFASIRKSFSFARPSTEQSQQQQQEKSPSRSIIRKEKSIFGPVLQTLRERASTHRLGIAQLFKKKE